MDMPHRRVVNSAGKKSNSFSNLHIETWTEMSSHPCFTAVEGSVPREVQVRWRHEHEVAAMQRWIQRGVGRRVGTVAIEEGEKDA